MIIKSVEKFEPVIGMTSLVGIMGDRDYPLSFGNYFSIHTPDNMWGL